MAMDDISQTQRQWLLLRKLGVDPEGSTIKRLSDELQVSEKTIRRDVAELRAAGFAIRERAEDHGRKTFSFEPSALPPLTFTCDEALALYVSRTGAWPWSGTYVGESLMRAFRKIRATLPEKTSDYVRRTAERFARTGLGGAYEPQAEVLDQLQIGLEDSWEVRLTYRSERATEPVTYGIHPYGIVEHRGAMYVVGHSPEHGEVRTWKVDRVAGAEVTRRRFERPAEFDLQRFLAGSIGVYHGREGEEVTVRVRFASSAARYACERRLHASQQATAQRDGSVIVEWRVASTVELRAYVLSFGAAAEVLAPVELREEVRQEVESLRRLYAADASPRREPRRAPSKPIANQLRPEEQPSTDRRRRTKQRRAK